MDDDIVTRLRQFVRGCNHNWNLGNEWYPAPTECVSCIRQRDAADEIERLRAETRHWKNCANAYEQGNMTLGDKLFSTKPAVEDK